MVQEIRSLQKLAIFFQGLTLGVEGGGGLYAVLYGICGININVVMRNIAHFFYLVKIVDTANL